MKTRAILWAVPLALIFPVPASAQEGVSEYERGELLFVQTVLVSPTDARAYELVMAKFADAAEAAGLSADYGWTYLNEGFTYTMVFPFKDYAYWDDPQQWMRAFEQGTEAEEMLQEAMVEFYDLDVRTVASEVIEHVPEWSFAPAAHVEPTMVHVSEFWLRPGKQEEFSQLSEDVVAFLEEIGYAYPISGHRVHFGDTDRTLFVTWYDSRTDYYGAKSLDAAIAEKGAQEGWGQLIRRVLELIIDVRDSDRVMKPAMGYSPKAEEGGTP